MIKSKFFDYCVFCNNRSLKYNWSSLNLNAIWKCDVIADYCILDEYSVLNHSVIPNYWINYSASIPNLTSFSYYRFLYCRDSYYCLWSYVRWLWYVCFCYLSLRSKIFKEILIIRQIRLIRCKYPVKILL